MAQIDKTFKDLCEAIKKNGKEYHNTKRNVKRLQIPSYTFRHEFKDGFPALTNKKMYWKGVVGELIWFLRGDNNVKYLNDNGINFWNKDAYNWYVKHGGTLSFEKFAELGEGSVGQNYSVQWRNFNGKTDQITELIKNMKSDIMSSQLIVEAWNPSELKETALAPCHKGFQVIGVPLDNGKFGFELHWNQRSVDTFLGVPMNIASYALLAEILAHKTGYKALAIQGDLKCVHFYDNQYDGVDELLSRDVNKHSNCKLMPLGFDLDLDFDDYEIDFFKLLGYTSDKTINVEMLAPLSI
jgi:thymidylate synthase